MSQEFVLAERSTWSAWQMLAFATVVLLGMELLNWLVPRAFAAFDRIPAKAKHLDKLEFKVRACPTRHARACAPIRVLCIALMWSRAAS
jgi:hypothetical protein